MPQCLNVAIILDFGMWGVIAGLITHTKCILNQFRGSGVLTPQNLSISIRLINPG